MIKALYGLKQGGRRWEVTLRNKLVELGFECCSADPGMFQQTHDSKRLILLVYVDDIIMIGNCDRLRTKFIADIHKLWETTEVSELEWCLGIKIHHNKEKKFITLDQKLYISDTIKRFFEDGIQCTPKRNNSPCTAEEIRKLVKGAPDSTETPQVIDTYRSLIGALLWIANITRPDVSYAVSTLAKFTSCPEQAHLKSAFAVLTYLAKTSHCQLALGDFTGKDLCGQELKAPSTIIGFTDSSWGDEKPASGYCCYYKGSLISWASRRLKTTPLSSCEAEYAAATNAASTLMHNIELSQFLNPKLEVNNTRLYCDNSAACQLSDNALSGKRVKHVTRQLAFLRELKEENKLSLHFISGAKNIADIFTKPLATPRFVELRDQLLLMNEDQTKRDRLRNPIPGILISY